MSAYTTLHLSLTSFFLVLATVHAVMWWFVRSERLNAWVELAGFLRARDERRKRG